MYSAANKKESYVPFDTQGDSQRTIQNKRNIKERKKISISIQLGTRIFSTFFFFIRYYFIYFRLALSVCISIVCLYAFRLTSVKTLAILNSDNEHTLNIIKMNTNEKSNVSRIEARERTEPTK